MKEKQREGPDREQYNKHNAISLKPYKAVNEEWLARESKEGKFDYDLTLLETEERTNIEYFSGRPRRAWEQKSNPNVSYTLDHKK